MTLARRDVPAVAQGRAHVRQHLSRSLPYYLTPDEVHNLIDVTKGARDQLLLRLLWETGVRISEAIALSAT